MYLPAQQTKLALPECLTRTGVGVSLMDYQDKAGIYYDDEALSSVWVIKNGFVKIHRISVHGRQVTLSILGQGALFGAVEPGQCGQGESASAQGAVQAYRVSVAQFDKFLSGEPDFARFVTSSLCRRKNILQRRLFGIMNRKVEYRLAALLCDLATNEGERCIHGGEIDLKLTQLDLADMIGASRQVVSTILHELREQNIVHYTRNIICVIDLPALSLLADN